MKRKDKGIFEENKGEGKKRYNKKTIELINKRIKEYGDVLKGDDSPYLEEFGVVKGGVIYDMTKEEVRDYTRCAIDIEYFAEKHVKLKVETGNYEHFKLRDYQKEIFDFFKNNRFTILMASRQTGKCVAGTTMIDILENGKQKEIPIGYAYWKNKKGFMSIIMRSLYTLYAIL